MSLTRTIFVDESFFKWTSLADKQVNLAYGAVSIPDRAISAAKKRWKVYEELFRELIRADTGIEIPVGEEIKFTDTRKLTPNALYQIGRFWDVFYRKHHIRAFGLFAIAEGLGKNDLRNDAFDSNPDEFEMVIENQEELYAAWLSSSMDHKEKMKEEGKGDLGVLEKLIKPFVSCIFHNHLDIRGRQPFSLIWDHRSGEEDGLKEIVADIVELIRKSMRLSEAELNRLYRGLTIRHSDDEAGLRYADFVAGSYRNLFRSYPELLTDNTAFEIKSAKYNDEMLSPWRPFYKRPMSRDLADSLISNSKEIIFPHLIPRLAGGMFTYFTKDGDARHCRPSERMYYDMAD